MAPTYPQVRYKKLNAAVQRSPLTQAEIARRVGVDESTLTGWLDNYRRPHLDNLKRMAEVLDVEITDLVHRGKDHAS